MAAKKPKTQSNTIVLNKRARFDYHLHEKIEAGLVLEGWEVKALREKNAQLVDSYVFIQKGEAYLSGCNLTPTTSVSTHINPEPQRTRKLLMHRQEIDRLVGGIQKKGQTCVATALYWKNNRVKCEIALASGKKSHDKRQAIKERDWNRDKSRMLKETR